MRIANSVIPPKKIRRCSWLFCHEISLEIGMGITSIHPIFIAEIDKVLPRLPHSVFNPKKNVSDIFFPSKFSVRMGSKRKWFDLPNQKRIDYVAIMEHLFIKHFTLEEYQRLDAEQYFGDVASDIDINKKDSEVDDDNNNVSGIQQDLTTFMENLKVGDADCEDWENVFKQVMKYIQHITRKWRKRWKLVLDRRNYIKRVHGIIFIDCLFVCLVTVPRTRS